MYTELTSRRPNVLVKIPRAVITAIPADVIRIECSRDSLRWLRANPYLKKSTMIEIQRKRNKTVRHLNITMFVCAGNSPLSVAPHPMKSYGGHSICLMHAKRLHPCIAKPVSPGPSIDAQALLHPLFPRERNAFLAVACRSLPSKLRKGSFVFCSRHGLLSPRLMAVQCCSIS